MKRGPLSSERPAPARAFAGRAASIWHLPFFILFFCGYVAAFTMLVLQVSPPWRWTEGLLFVLAAITSVATLARFLPMQNALAAAAVIVLGSGLIMSVGVKSGLPFGPFHFIGNTGPELFDTLPVVIPLLWVVILLNSRGVALLLMRPHRDHPNYGFWVIGLTALLAMLVDVGLEPYAVKVRHYWVWRTRDGIPNWYAAPLVSFLGWFVAALAISVFTLPWLINKKTTRTPVDMYPLIVWLLLNLYLLAGNATHQLWPAVVVGGTITVTVAGMAWRGARFVEEPVAKNYGA